MDCWDLLGVCIEPKIGLDNAVLAILGIVGLVSVYFAYKQLRFGQRAQQIDIAIRLHGDFFSNQELREFLYRLDYDSGPNAWKFDPLEFPHSEEEKHLDILLYKLSIIGGLVSNGDLTSKDLQWLRAEAGIVLENEEVLNYLEWLKSPFQIPDHSSFAGAVYLYKALFGTSGSAYPKLASYLGQMKRKR